MTPLVSVLTPTIHERCRFRGELEASVGAQTFKDFEHIIGFDPHRNGCAKTMNWCAKQAHGEWLLPIADDDLLLPRCIESLVRVAEGYDVVYPVPLVWGENAEEFSKEPPNIPAVALIRRSVWEELGGYDETLVEREDNSLWERMIQQDKTFLRYDASPTWVYRFHGSNKSRR